MKRDQRVAWLALSSEIVGPPLESYESEFATTVYPLCSFCRYSDYEDGYGPYCEHPIDAVREPIGDFMLADHPRDCWAFRPERGLTIEAARQRVERHWEEYREGRRETGDAEESEPGLQPIIGGIQ